MLDWVKFQDYESIVRTVRDQGELVSPRGQETKEILNMESVSWSKHTTFATRTK